MKPFSTSGAFDPLKDNATVRALAVKGAGVTVMAQGALFAVQLISTVILARLLTPDDFGVVAMVTTFSLILVSVGLNGFTEAILQWEEINHLLASNLFWINAAAGLAFTALFAAAGSLLAKFYHDPRVIHVAMAVSASIFFTSISVEHLALLKRTMHFTAVSINDIVARALSVVVAVYMAWAGWGYWALVAAAVVQPLATSVGAWILCRWTPGLPKKVPGTARLVWFAINIYGRYIFNYCTRNSDNLLVGWKLGPEALGFYKKAYDLFLLPANQFSAPLTAVAVSALSRFQRNSAQYRRYFLSALAVMAFFGMWLGGDMTLIGQDIIRFILGPGWERAGRIFTFFGPGIGVMLLYSTHGWIHLSIGTANRWLRWVFVEFTVTLLLFVLGLHWGPEGIAVAWALSFWLLAIPAFWYAGKPIDFGIAPMAAVVWKYMIASLIAGCIAAAFIRRTIGFGVAPNEVAAAIRIVVISVGYSTVYLTMVVILHGGSAPLYQFAGLLREMLPWAKSQEAVSADSEVNEPEIAPALAYDAGNGNSKSGNEKEIYRPSPMIRTSPR